MKKKEHIKLKVGKVTDKGFKAHDWVELGLMLVALLFLGAMALALFTAIIRLCIEVAL